MTENRHEAYTYASLARDHAEHCDRDLRDIPPTDRPPPAGERPAEQPTPNVEPRSTISFASER